MSADGEQVEDDADRIHKRAEDLEQFIRDTLLGAKGSRNTTFPSVACLPPHPVSWDFWIYLSTLSPVSSVIRSTLHYITLY